MRNRLIAYLLLAMLAVTGTAQAREPEKPNVGQSADVHAEPAKWAQEAIDRLKTDGVGGFIGVAFSGRKGSLRPSDRGAAETFFNKLHDTVVAHKGKPLGEIELVRTDILGHSIIRFIYVEKLERGLLMWSMSFYQSNTNEWRWNALNVNDNQLNAEFRPVKEDTRYQEAAALAQQGIDALKASEITKLYDAVLAAGKSVIVTDRSLSELSMTMNYKKAIVALNLGKPLGKIELVRTEAIGESLVRFVYLEKFEEGAIVWKFSFYNVAGQWKWQDLNFGEWGNEFVAK